MNDPIRTLERLAAQRGRVPPDDLVRDVVQWLSDAAPLILAGTPPAEALGLAARQGAWQSAPVHRARFGRRDAALRELWGLTTGSDRHRVWQIEDWLADWCQFTHSALPGSEARRILAAVPEDAREPLEELARVGLRLPGQRALLRAVRPASHGADGAEASARFTLEAPPIAAHENRT